MKNWKEEFDEIYPPLFIDNGFDLVEEEVDKKYRNKLKQFIQNLLDEQREEIREMIEKMGYGSPSHLEDDKFDSNYKQAIKDILKQLK